VAADITACPSGTRALVMAIIGPFGPRLPACGSPVLTVGGQLGGRRAGSDGPRPAWFDGRSVRCGSPASAPGAGTLRPVVVAYPLALAAYMCQYRSSHICSNQPEFFSLGRKERGRVRTDVS